MRLAYLLSFVFSIGGLLVLSTVLSLWLIIRPRSRVAPRALLIVVLAYTSISIYSITRAAVGLWSRPFAPLEKSDALHGKIAIVILPSQ